MLCLAHIAVVKVELVGVLVDCCAPLLAKLITDRSMNEMMHRLMYLFEANERIN